MVLSAVCGCRTPEPAAVDRPAQPTPAAPASAPDMARQQLFFVGFHGDPLLVVVFQRQTDGRTTELEAKAFLAWGGAWRPPCDTGREALRS